MSLFTSLSSVISSDVLSIWMDFVDWDVKLLIQHLFCSKHL